MIPFHILLPPFYPGSFLLDPGHTYPNWGKNPKQRVQYPADNETWAEDSIFQNTQGNLQSLYKNALGIFLIHSSRISGNEILTDE